ncbi:MAG: hypothetical protein F7B17_06575 [Desulfurococcales archaeon]|nr:hypothetical protein [Desulfurococcales archaeon]
MVKEKVVLVASIGFTVDFVAKRVNDIGREKLAETYLVGLYTGDEGAWRRVEQAYNLLANYLKAINVDSELVKVGSGPGLMGSLRNLLYNARRKASAYGFQGVVEVFVTGGPRLLSLAMSLAALLIEAEERAVGEGLRVRSRIVAYGEAFEDSLTVDVGNFVKLFSLDKLSWRILRELRSERSAKELISSLQTPKSTLYKRLGDLKNAGIIEPSPSRQGYWRLSPSIEDLVS